MSIPRFGDISNNKTLEGDKVKIDSLLGKEIIVTGYSVGKSKFPSRDNDTYLKVQFYFVNDTSEERKVFFSGSNVLKDQAEEMEQKLSEQGLPYTFGTTIKKVGNYYSFT